MNHLANIYDSALTRIYDASADAHYFKETEKEEQLEQLAMFIHHCYKTILPANVKVIGK